MEYVMNQVEKELFDLIEQDGCTAPIQVTIRALIEYAHKMSDLGLKDQARKALEVSDILKDVRDSIEE